MPRIIEYSLEGNGWAVGAINLNRDRIDLDTSYIVDTFSQMTDAVLAICEGAPSASWNYFHGPTSTRVDLKNIENREGMVELTVTTYADLYSGTIPIHVKGELLAKDVVPQRQLVSDVIAAGTRMLDTHGMDGYLIAFHHPFPAKDVQMLKDVRRAMGSPI